MMEMFDKLIDVAKNNGGNAEEIINYYLQHTNGIDCSAIAGDFISYYKGTLVPFTNYSSKEELESYLNYLNNYTITYNAIEEIANKIAYYDSWKNWI